MKIYGIGSSNNIAITLSFELAVKAPYKLVWTNKSIWQYMPQRRIQNTVSHIRWSVFRKQLNKYTSVYTSLLNNYVFKIFSASFNSWWMWFYIQYLNDSFIRSSFQKNFLQFSVLMLGTGENQQILRKQLWKRVFKQPIGLSFY